MHIRMVRCRIMVTIGRPCSVGITRGLFPLLETTTTTRHRHRDTRPISIHSPRIIPGTPNTMLSILVGGVGVLQLGLWEGGADFRFVTIDGVILDSGSISCY